MMDDRQMREMIDYYIEQGAPQDQQMLIALLREAQEADGGVLSQGLLSAIAQACGVKVTMLQALMRRVPGMRSESVPHRLEICGTCKESARLRDDIERMYAVKGGGCSEVGRFSYWVTSCMKNCKNGPSVKWDGKLYSHASVELIQKLVGKA